MLCLLALVAASTQDTRAETVNFVNGIGLIDYASRPSLKVGQWARYHMTGTSQLGEKDDYQVTVLVIGEERFWGEDCFWIETWTEPKNSSPRAMATLMSYSVFTDSMPNIRSQYYMRKSVDGIHPDTGLPLEQVVRRPASTLKKRGQLLEAPAVKLDTLGTESITVPAGTFECRKVHWQEGKAATVDQRDSSLTTEVRENRMQYFSSKVPVTGLVRESIERSIKRRTWAIGRSSEASPLNVMDIANGDAVLIATGEDGKSRLFPESRQKSLKEIDAAQRRSAAPAAKSATAAQSPSSPGRGPSRTLRGRSAPSRRAPRPRRPR